MLTIVDIGIVSIIRTIIVAIIIGIVVVGIVIIVVVVLLVVIEIKWGVEWLFDISIGVMHIRVKSYILFKDLKKVKINKVVWFWWKYVLGKSSENWVLITMLHGY